LLPLYGHFPTRQALANAKTAALRAVALDSTLAEAHTSLAVMHLEYDHDREAAEREYRKAIALNPEEASFRMALALSYERLQKPAEAVAAYTEALRLSPNAPDADSVRARIAQLTAPATRQAPAGPAPAGSGR
jgi:Flp pilus assembly protein TadD